MYIRKIEERTFADPQTGEERTKTVITFQDFHEDPLLAGMSLGCPKDAKYGNVFLNSESLEDAKAKYKLGADYSNLLEFGEPVVDKATGEVIPNVYNVQRKAQG